MRKILNDHAYHPYKKLLFSRNFVIAQKFKKKFIYHQKFPPKQNYVVKKRYLHNHHSRRKREETI